MLYFQEKFYSSLVSENPCKIYLILVIKHPRSQILSPTWNTATADGFSHFLLKCFTKATKLKHGRNSSTIIEMPEMKIAYMQEKTGMLELALVHIFFTEKEKLYKFKCSFSLSIPICDK